MTRLPHSASGLLNIASIRNFLLSLGLAGFATPLVGCAEPEDDDGEVLNYDERRVSNFCSLDADCYQTKYQTHGECVEALTISSEETDECREAYHELLSCLTASSSCVDLENFYIRSPVENYPCQEEDAQVYLCAGS